MPTSTLRADCAACEGSGVGRVLYDPDTGQGYPEYCPCCAGSGLDA